MSASVWFEEVNTGLITELKKTVKIYNASGTLEDLPVDAFSIRKPDEDFKVERCPCISIYAKNYKHNTQRQYPYRVVTSTDSVNHKVTEEDPAVAFDLFYQIDFWSRLQTDMDTMTRTWLMRHFRQFNLPVIDDGGTHRTCNVMQDGSVVRSDLVENEKRLFHTIIPYRIWVEIDDELEYTEPMVNDIVVSADEK